MSSTINRLCYRNLSLCIYIGNTASFDDQLLLHYCSQFGQVLSCTDLNCPADKRSFCDFRIIEFATKHQVDYFLSQSLHKLGSIILDVKLFEHLWNNFELLNIDRKIFIGPIDNPNHVNLIVQFYQLIDPKLNFRLTRRYVLLECSNRQYTRAIIQQKTIPKTFDNQIFHIYLPIHPKELIGKRNPRNQLCVEGLTDQNSENILMDYFEKHASIIAYWISDDHSAMIEFENEHVVAKLLEQPLIHLHGIDFSFTKVPNTILSTIENKTDFNNDKIAQSPEIRECGWTSPPRAVPIDYVTRLASKPSTKIDLDLHSRVIETDVKPIRKDIWQLEIEIEQIREEYRAKFHRDRTLITSEFARLIHDEQMKFDKLRRQRKHS